MTRTNNTETRELERLKLLLKAINQAAEDIAVDCRISVHGLEAMLTAELPVDGRLLRELHYRYGASLDWLLSGVGTMFVDDAPERLALVPRLETLDTRDMQDVFITAAGGIEQSLQTCGAQPGTDYTLLELYQLALPFVLERFKDAKTDLKFFG